MRRFSVLQVTKIGSWGQKISLNIKHIYTHTHTHTHSHRQINSIYLLIIFHGRRRQLGLNKSLENRVEKHWTRSSKFFSGFKTVFLKNYYYYCYFIYLFLTALGLRCWAWASLVVASGGYPTLRCVGFSLWWLLLQQSTGFRRAGFSSCGTGAQLLHGMWDLPGPGLEPVSPALAGGFLTTAPPRKYQKCMFLYEIMENEFPEKLKTRNF